MSTIAVLGVVLLYWASGPIAALVTVMLPTGGAAFGTVLVLGLSTWLFGWILANVRVAIPASLFQVGVWAVSGELLGQANWRTIGAFYLFLIPVLLPLLALCSGISAAVASERRTRAREGCCKICGYCLKGLVSDTCPECGTRVTKQ